MENLFLAIPDKSHEKAYTEMMNRWEEIETNINPSLLGRYSDNKKRNLTYAEWLACCEDDRTTGSMLSTGVPWSSPCGHCALEQKQRLRQNHVEACFGEVSGNGLRQGGDMYSQRQCRRNKNNSWQRRSADGRIF